MKTVKFALSKFGYWSDELFLCHQEVQRLFPEVKDTIWVSISKTKFQGSYKARLDIDKIIIGNEALEVDISVQREIQKVTRSTFYFRIQYEVC